MKKIKKISIPALIVTLAFVFAVVPAIAHDGSGSDDNAHAAANSRQSAGDDDGTGTDTPGRGRGEAMADSRRHKRTEAERRHACESHKQGLENKFSHIVANSQSLHERITDVLDKTLAYQRDNDLTVDNFSSLVAAAESAQSDTDTAIANLRGVTPSLDCNNVSVADDVANFKTVAKHTRDSLKDYRDAVKDVIKALLGAKQAGGEGSDQS